MRIGYRPIPHDFIETFARVGLDGIEDEYHCCRRTAIKWMNVLGYEMVAQKRREWLEQHYATNLGGRKIPGRRPGQRGKRYVLGRTLSPIIEPGKAE